MLANCKSIDKLLHKFDLIGVKWSEAEPTILINGLYFLVW